MLQEIVIFIYLRFNITTLLLTIKGIKSSLPRSEIARKLFIKIYFNSSLTRSSECQIRRSGPNSQRSDQSQAIRSRLNVGGKQQLASSDLHDWYFTLLQGMLIFLPLLFQSFVNSIIDYRLFRLGKHFIFALNTYKSQELSKNKNTLK